MSAYADELRAQLGAVLAPGVVSILDELVAERIREALATQGTAEGRRWLTVAQAAERLSCSRDAVRMRAKRGRLECRRQGRTLYIAAASVENLG